MTGALTEKQSARRERVLEAAAKLASAGGYDAVQMRDVASEADVALGTLYRYFASKDQLLVAVLARWASELEQRVTTRPPRGETPAARVVDILRRAVRSLEREPTLSAALVTALTTLSAEDPKALADAGEVYRTMGQIITSAIRDDEIPDREAVIRALGQVWLAALVAWVRGWAPPGQMLKDLESAANLMLPA